MKMAETKLTGYCTVILFSYAVKLHGMNRCTNCGEEHSENCRHSPEIKDGFTVNEISSTHIFKFPLNETMILINGPCQNISCLVSTCSHVRKISKHTKSEGVKMKL
jgi:hypothetical protein